MKQKHIETIALAMKKAGASDEAITRITGRTFIYTRTLEGKYTKATLTS